VDNRPNTEVSKVPKTEVANIRSITSVGWTRSESIWLFMWARLQGLINLPVNALMAASVRVETLSLLRALSM
jgi:hypothetical protein